MKLLAVPLFVTLFASIAAAADSKLSIEHPTLHQSEDGPSVPGSFQFVPGDLVFFSCQLGGYKKVEKEHKEIINLSYTIEVRDQRGVLLAPVEEGKIATEVSAEDKNWMPKVRFSFSIPSFVDSGEYQILTKAKDEMSGGEAQARTQFTVQGRDVPPSDTLMVRNFRFLRTEEDQNPLAVAAYRPGDMVWARFEMTGYKIGEKNQFDIEYGLTVLRPNGQVTYSQPHAAEEKTQTFYPQRYNPGVLSLNLPKDLQLGEYTIVLTVRDNLGAQTYESKQKFSVE